MKAIKNFFNSPLMPYGIMVAVAATIAAYNGLWWVVACAVVIELGLALRRLREINTHRFLFSLAQRQQEVIMTMREADGAIKGEDPQQQPFVDPRKVMFEQMRRAQMKPQEDDGEKFELVKPDSLKVKLADVKGLNETKKDVEDFIKAFTSADKIKAIGGEAPHGLLLKGSPGTGKTLIAKCIAAEAGCNFIAVSGSQFNEKYIGVGQSRIRALFKTARKNAPCIIFIDEIDGLAPARGSSESSERDNTLNQLLVEMDGFANNEGVFVIGATNRDELLDDAVTRPGRLDRVITVPLPDKKGRKEVLSFYLNKVKCYPVDVDRMVAKTAGFSPAEIKNIVNTAAVLAVTDGKEVIDNHCLDEAYFKILMKGNKKESVRDAYQDQLIAYHETGHALVHRLLLGNEIPEVNIIECTSGAGGVTIHTSDDEVLPSRTNIRGRIIAMYAGRAAEEIFTRSKDLMTTGASSDIHQASRLIRSYLEKWGMNNDVLLDYSVFKKDGDSLADAKTLSSELYQEALDFLNKNREVLDAVAAALVEQRSLDNDELDKIIASVMPSQSVEATA